MKYDIFGLELTQGEQNLILLQKTLPEAERLYLWICSLRGSILATTCPAELEEAFKEAFRISGALETALARYPAQRKEDTAILPFLVGSSFGLVWAVTFERERGNALMVAVGPVFYERQDERKIRSELDRLPGTETLSAWKNAFLSRIGDVPVMSFPVFARYVILIHNAINQDQLGPDALTTPASSSNASASENAPAKKKVDNQEGKTGKRNREQVYMAERALLRMVRNGDLSYQTALHDSIQKSSGTPVQGSDPLRQAKTSVTVFTTLVSRAAMEGGLLPDAAYSLGDSYIQAAEDCRDLGELSALSAAMLHDFVMRVNRLRVNPNVSHAVRKCCDYIELNLDKPIRVEELASLTGYAPYYLSDKFKKETGMTVAAFVRCAKIERAKILLTTTKKSVREISETLAFHTPNYFIACFRETTGTSPAQYRREKAGEYE